MNPSRKEVLEDFVLLVALLCFAAGALLLYLSVPVQSEGGAIFGAVCVTLGLFTAALIGKSRLERWHAVRKRAGRRDVSA